MDARLRWAGVHNNSTEIAETVFFYRRDALVSVSDTSEQCELIEDKYLCIVDAVCFVDRTWKEQTWTKDRREETISGESKSILI